MVIQLRATRYKYRLYFSVFIKTQENYDVTTLILLWSILCIDSPVVSSSLKPDNEPDVYFILSHKTRPKNSNRLFLVAEDVLRVSSTKEMSSRNVFDSLTQKPTSEPHYNVHISDRLWKKAGSAQTKNKNFHLRSFDYDLDHNCFVPTKSEQQDVKSLFFDYLQQHGKSSHDFFVLNFMSTGGKGEIEESQINRDAQTEKILRGGVNANGRHYNIVGCSNSGVQKRSFYFMSGTETQCRQLLLKFIPNLEQLARKKGIAKRVKYAGLLFTGCQYIVDLPQQFKFKIATDVEKGTYNFTDGCGLISLKLAEKIWKSNTILAKKWKKLPSVWQIRYYGNKCLCKGVLIVDYGQKDEMVLTVRKSLVKVPAANDDSEVSKYLRARLGIVATSLKPKVGKLNKQVVALLSSNVNKDALISIQSDYLDRVSKARNNPLDALFCFALKGQFNNFQQLLRKHAIDMVPPGYLNLPQQVQKIQSEKLQIPLANSRLLLGASFPERLVGSEPKEGQCVVKDEFGFVEGKVVVCRSPSYAPGDLQVLEAIALPPQHPVSSMHNVIIFSTQGQRPDPDKMSGGDLDGDLYLVIWDERILKFWRQIGGEEIQEYDGPSGSTKTGKQDEDWIRYIAVWENSMLAQIDACFFQLAAEKGVKSPECIKLCGLFSRAVDQHPSDLQDLKKLIVQCSSKNQSSLFIAKDVAIWEYMMEKQLALFQTLNKMSAPTKVEWDSFYGRLICIDKSQIENALNHVHIRACSSSKERFRLENAWKTLCKNSCSLNAPEVVLSTSLDEHEYCTFDCKVATCVSPHPPLAEWHQEWSEIMKSRMNVFIEPFKAQILEHQLVVAGQDKLLAAMMQSYQKKLAEYQDMHQKCIDTNKRLTHYSSYCQKISTAKDSLRSLQQQSIPTGFEQFTHTVENACAKLFLGRNRQKSQKELDLISAIEDQVERITSLVQSYHMDLMKERWSLEQVEGQARDILSESGFGSGFVWISESKLVSFIRSSEVMVERQLSLLKKPDINLDMNRCRDLQKEKDVLDSMLEKENIRREQADCKMEDLEDSFREQVEELSRARDEYEELSADLSEEDQQSLLSQIMNFIKEGRKNLDQLRLQKEMMKSQLVEIDRKIIDLQQRRPSLDQQLHNLYNEEARNDALTGISEVTIKTKPFDLALCALLNEVNFRTSVHPDMKQAERAKLNRELELCLSREQNRCEREQSDSKLPVFSKRCDILDALRDNDVLIVVANTGSGKSTQVPQYLADDLHHVLDCAEKFPKIACTQPRRVAATGIANRVALEYSGSVPVPKPTSTKKSDVQPIIHNSRTASLVAYPLYAASDQRGLDEWDRVGSHQTIKKQKVKEEEVTKVRSSEDELRETPGEIGGWVGYQIGSTGKSAEERKNSKKVCPYTRIEFVTEGLLLQKLKQQQDSTNYQCIIIDEAHERGKDTDLLLALLRKMVLGSCKVKVVVMSASINSQQFSEYFDSCPVIDCEGRMFDVDVRYLPIPEEIAQVSDASGGDSSSEEDSSDEDDSVCVSPVILHAVNVLFSDIYPLKDEGDVLIFLPGAGEIHTCVDLIRQRAEKEWKGCPPPTFVRKVVCCTNIAETSLTIPGVRYVIDAGLAKRIAYDHQLRVTTLQLQKTSQAAAKQRKGRAGRVQPGVCYRLCSEGEFAERDKFDEPEMKQCPIDELYLYTLIVFGSMEDLHLMEDAQPPPESIASARERLLNLGFAERDTMSGSLKVSQDGELALMLNGEVSLEGTRMIIAARETGVVSQAVTLAVLLQSASNLEKRFKERNQAVEENRKEYLDEFGDHFTLLNMYNAYQQRKQKQKLVSTWCDDNGFCLPIFKQIQKSIDSVYQTLKRSKMLGEIIVEKLCHTSVKEKLCKVLVAGFFHNIAELHDKDYLRAGYSLLTPATMGENSDEEDFHLLKVHLSNQSSLVTQGDVVDNTYVMFTNLYRTSFGKVLMQQNCRIQPNWIIEYTSKRWQQIVGLREDGGHIKSFVTRNRIQFIGPQIQASLLSADKRYIKKLEAETGAAVICMFDAAEVRCYGSQSEVEEARSDIVNDVHAKKLEFTQNDNAVQFYTHPRPEPICDIKSGLCVENITIPMASRQTSWGLFQSALIMFRKVPQGRGQDVLAAIEKLKPDRSSYNNELVDYWGTPEIDGEFTDKSGVHCCKVKFSSLNVAQHVMASWSKYFASQNGLGEAHCFEDREIRVRVVNTDVYPSVKLLAEKQFPSVSVLVHKNAFTFKLKNKKDKDMSPVDDFLNFLNTHETFQSLSLKDLDIGLPTKNYKFVTDQLSLLEKRVKKKLPNHKAIVYLQQTPQPWFEIFGDDKTVFCEELKSEVKKLRFDVANQKFNFVFYKQHQLQRHQLRAILQQLKTLRKRFPNVTFQVSNVKGRDKELPCVELLSKSSQDGTKASNEVQWLLRGKGNVNDNMDVAEEWQKCVECKKKVTLRKRGKNKKTEKGETVLNLDEEEVVSRLTLCGCVYCTSCLQTVISDQLQLQTTSHMPLVCCPTPGCSQAILNRDLRENLSRDMVKELHQEAVISYLNLWAQQKTIEEEREARAYGNTEIVPRTVVSRCTDRKCGQVLVHRVERGAYQCPCKGCSRVYCCLCGASIHNAMTFDYHFGGRCGGSKHFCTLL